MVAVNERCRILFVFGNVGRNNLQSNILFRRVDGTGAL